MVINTKCKCGAINNSEISIDWIKDGVMPITCNECGDVYLTNVVADVEEQTIQESESDQQQEEKTIHEIESMVEIIGGVDEIRGHTGTIIDKDFYHYKIKIEDGRSVWVPYDWVDLKKKKN